MDQSYGFISTDIDYRHFSKNQNASQSSGCLVKDNGGRALCHAC